MSILIQPGRYFIADPCYVLEDERYEKLINNFTNEGNAEYRENDFVSIAFGTAHGDGEYSAAVMHELVKLVSAKCDLPVDSGLIAITSIELCIEDIQKEYDEPIGFIVDIESPIFVSEDDGVIVFGDIFIDTNYQDEDEEGWF